MSWLEGLGYLVMAGFFWICFRETYLKPDRHMQNRRKR